MFFHFRCTGAKATGVFRQSEAAVHWTRIISLPLISEATGGFEIVLFFCSRFKGFEARNLLGFVGTRTSTLSTRSAANERAHFVLADVSGGFPRFPIFPFSVPLSAGLLGTWTMK